MARLRRGTFLNVTFFKYDKDADALDITLREGLVARTEEIDTGTLLDFDAAGHLVAIEVIRPARDWPLDEILSRFTLDSDVEAVLRSLWSSSPARYPFGEPAEAEPAQLATVC